MDRFSELCPLSGCYLLLATKSPSFDDAPGAKEKKNENLITRKENLVGGKKKISGILQGSLIKTYIRLLVPCTLHVAIKGKGSY